MAKKGSLYTQTPFSTVNQGISVLTGAGFNQEDWEQFLDTQNGPKLARKMLAVMRGGAKIHMTKHKVDCSLGLESTSFSDERWETVHHDTSLGQIEFDIFLDIRLYQSRDQRDGKCVSGNKVHKELQGRTLMWLLPNYHFMAFFQLHPEFITSWIGKRVFFLGTVCKDTDYRPTRLFAPALDYCDIDKKWKRGIFSLDEDLGENYRMAVLPAPFVP